MAELTYTNVVWTAGDTVTEAKMDNMVANDRAVDAMNNGMRMTERADPATPPANTLHLYVKDKNSVSTLYAINDAGGVYELSEVTPVFSFPVADVLFVQTKATTPLIVHKSLIITKAYAYVGTAPVGANIIFDIKKNGSSIWNSTPSNRLIILDGQQSGNQTNFDLVSLVEGDILIPDIVQVGASTPGSDAIIELKTK